MQEEEGPLEGDAATGERVLALEFDHKPLAEVLKLETDRSESFLKDPSSVHVRVGNRADYRLAPEVDSNNLPPIVCIDY